MQMLPNEQVLGRTNNLCTFVWNVAIKMVFFLVQKHFDNKTWHYVIGTGEIFFQMSSQTADV